MNRFICRRRYVTYPGLVTDVARSFWNRKTDDGTPVVQFERALADYHQVSGAVCFSSGREALLKLLTALGLQPGDELLVPAYTLRALVELLREQGYHPIAIEIESDSYQMDGAKVAAQITPKTRAILATHLFGSPCSILNLKSIAERHQLLLIEDCAQALGAEVNGIKVGSFGDAAILSFDLLKPVNTFGGGAVLSKNPQLLEQLRQHQPLTPLPTRQLMRKLLMGLVEHGLLISPAARWVAAALNHPRTRAWVTRRYRNMQNTRRPEAARYTPLQAHIGLRLLNSLDARVAIRRDMAYRLSVMLGESYPQQLLKNHNGYFFVRRVKGDPNSLRQSLLKAGIDSGYQGEVADYCGDIGSAAGSPIALDTYQRALQLPLHEGLTDHDLKRIAALCRGHLENQFRHP